jgi:hypothetical protein
MLVCDDECYEPLPEHVGCSALTDLPQPRL